MSDACKKRVRLRLIHKKRCLPLLSYLSRLRTLERQRSTGQWSTDNRRKHAERAPPEWQAGSSRSYPRLQIQLPEMRHFGTIDCTWKESRLSLLPPSPRAAFSINLSLYDYHALAAPRFFWVVALSRLHCDLCNVKRTVPCVSLSSCIVRVLRREREMTGKGDEQTMAPPWLVPLLSTPFFFPCNIHRASARGECNFFCLDCPSSSAFCFCCRTLNHLDHRVIQASLFHDPCFYHPDDPFYFHHPCHHDDTLILHHHDHLLNHRLHHDDH